MASICLRYTRTEEDAIEVLNNGFLRIFQQIEKFNPERGSLYTWMRKLMVHACADFVKQRQPIGGISLETEQDAGIEAEIIHRLDAKELLQTIRALPPATAAVLNLFAIEGYSHKEVAQLLNISTGTSKWHLSEAKKLLHQKLKTGVLKHE